MGDGCADGGMGVHFLYVVSLLSSYLDFVFYGGSCGFLVGIVTCQLLVLQKIMLDLCFLEDLVYAWWYHGFVGAFSVASQGVALGVCPMLATGVKKIQQLQRNHYSMGKLNSTRSIRYLGLSAHQVGILKSATEDGEIGFRFRHQSCGDIEECSSSDEIF
ncbi:uncharacterized protein LOC131248700 isoform X2 [Magnolia sinica]|uniref:uncharacterized protein LOC131248700 isoform X2 n=1 Tax=Magnolia sinica TaxID=86752 RepID=UPI00265AA504|nr:uncharacterized protein LOC131248700 isoform X2 [Magnolia sinica]